MTEKNKGGHELAYTDEIADKIIERICDGESLRSICLDDDMPARSTVFRWLSMHKGFSDQYARAKAHQAEVFFDELVSIADEKHVTYEKEDGEEVAVKFDATMVQHKRLQIDTRKWAIVKLLPKKYGDKQELEISEKVKDSGDHEW